MVGPPHRNRASLFSHGGLLHAVEAVVNGPYAAYLRREDGAEVEIGNTDMASVREGLRKLEKDDATRPRSEGPA